MEKIVLVGGGGHAAVVLEIIRVLGMYEVVGVVDPNAKAADDLGLPWLGDDAVLPDLFATGIQTAAVGIGGYRDNNARKNIYAKLKAAGFRAATLIHPSAVVLPSATVGEGCVFFAGVIVNTGARIGSNVIIATGSSVDHETVVEDHVLISAGVTIGAQLLVGEGALIAIGACAVSRVKIGRGALVAAGAVVIRDIEDDVTVAGVPARPVTPK